MTLEFNEVPDQHANGRSIFDWEKQNIERCRERMTDETYWKDGALHWSSNDSPVPPHVFRENFVTMPENQKPVYDAHTNKVLEGYRTFREEHGYSEEEKAEMRAAFGPNANVVNVITGQRIEL